MDNFYHNCAPKMEDGARHLTDHKDETRRNEYIKYINNIWRDDEYRYFLQTHGKVIMDREWNYFKKKADCSVQNCVHNYPSRVNHSQLVKERRAYDTLYNKSNLKPNARCRCPVYKDFRLNAD